MDELLKRLEKQIKELIDQHDHLKQTNIQLSHGKHMLAKEKDLLLNRQQKAITQIQTLVSKLKELEN